MMNDKQAKYILIGLGILFTGFFLYRVVWHRILIYNNHRYTIGIVKEIIAVSDGDCDIEYMFYVKGKQYHGTGGVECYNSNEKIGTKCWIEYYTNDPGSIINSIWTCPIPDSLLAKPMEEVDLEKLPCLYY
jgi:hypothetical protein